jgi:hypothetical protein
MDLVVPPNTPASDMITEGDNVLKRSPFFRDLTNMLTDPKVKKFIDKYMKNGSDIKSVMMFLKLGSEIQDRYGELSQPILAYIIDQMIHHPEARSTIARRTLLLFDDKTGTVLPPKSIR